MKTYIGCKVIQATPMSHNGFIEDVKNNPQSLLVEDEDGYCVKYPDGYMSWSPKEVFETAYREMSDEEKDLF